VTARASPLTPMSGVVLVSMQPKGACTWFEKRRIEVGNRFSRPGWQIEHLRVIFHTVRVARPGAVSDHEPQRLLIEARASACWRRPIREKLDRSGGARRCGIPARHPGVPQYRR